ncbi:BsuBI/PstI family type II restriction endonuclease [Leptospira stimsonii]|uniref:Restriction endonuclease n=1 Tax=Leptospira stimsonii TaxID=2202203 RepID=A0A8B3CIX5_9LEPT|nr:BsuBI/PstI family type II restriction endonuclease [Leptospira stimsonii]RHX83558.1 restriction endonuclease [Leptospira stimsonii]
MSRKNSKIEEAIEILTELRAFDPLLTKGRRERIALALLALANVRPNSFWKNAQNWTGRADSWSLSTREIITFWNTNYGLTISPGSYDDVRRKVLIYLVQAGIVLKSAGNPDANTNNPTRKYGISQEVGDLLRAYPGGPWKKHIEKFINKHGDYAARVERAKDLPVVPVMFPNGKQLELSVGEHNEIQKLIIENFLPRFLKKPVVLYVGDTNNKLLFMDEKMLYKVGIPTPNHDKLPDIIALDLEKNWIFLIEAVHSSNPISRVRHLELEELMKECKLDIVYVSAFKDRNSFRNWLIEISWETEVWLGDSPEHMIHFNGDKFLGPHIKK